MHMDIPHQEAEGVSEREGTAYLQKQLFLVDTQIFTNCFIFEVAFKGVSTNLDFFAFEAIAAAEMVWVCDRIREFYGPRAK